MILNKLGVEGEDYVIQFEGEARDGFNELDEAHFEDLVGVEFVELKLLRKAECLIDVHVSEVRVLTEIELPHNFLSFRKRAIGLL